MTKEFRPLVPATFKGKATFCISHNRINRVAATSGASTSSAYVVTQDKPDTRGNEIAHGRPDTTRHQTASRQPTPIAPRSVISIVPKPNIQGPSQNIVFNTSKFLLVNGSQLKPVSLKRAREISPVIIPHANQKLYTSILPYNPPPPSNYRPNISVEGSSGILPARQIVAKPPVTAVIDGGVYPRPKKPCNCTKSMCLKLYCDCFANGEFCSGCNCQNCHNNIQHESERSRSIRTCLERNPFAFHPKIGKTFQSCDGGADRHHSKGCHCKRSGCLKNYCECYEAKIPCSSLCKCVGCKNYSQTHTTLQQLADVAVVRHQQQHSVKQKFNSQLQDMNSTVPHLASLDDMSLDCLSMNLSAATCRCLLSAASHAVDHYFSMETIEKAIIEEFGQCLNKIIEKGTKTPELNKTQNEDIK